MTRIAGHVILDYSMKERAPSSQPVTCESDFRLIIIVWMKMSLDRVPPIPLSGAHVCGRNVCNKWLFSVIFHQAAFFLVCNVFLHSILKQKKIHCFGEEKRKIFRGQAPDPLTPHQDSDQLCHWNLSFTASVLVSQESCQSLRPCKSGLAI